MHIFTIVSKNGQGFQHAIGEDRKKVLEEANRLIEAKVGVAPVDAKDPEASFAEYQNYLADKPFFTNLAFLRVRYAYGTQEPANVASTANDTEATVSSEGKPAETKAEEATPPAPETPVAAPKGKKATDLT